jgi:1,6-anhydro-N-acetylmuramate kinase
MGRWLAVMTAVPQQLPAAGDPTSVVGGLTETIQTGGLAAVCAILLITVAYLYVSKERQRERLHDEYNRLQEGFQTKLLDMVERQTEVLTKQAILTDKVEGLMVKLVARLEDQQRRKE